MTPVSCKESPPPTDGHHVLFYYSAGYTIAGSGWFVGYLLVGLGWVKEGTPGRLLAANPGLLLPVERVTHWCELPPKPSEVCSCQFMKGKCPVCLMTLSEFEAKLYAADADGEADDS